MKLLKWGGYFIAGMLVLSVIAYLAGGEDTEETGDALAEMQAKGEAVQAEKDAEKKSESNAKADKKAKEEAEVEKALADFEDTEAVLVANSSGVISKIDVEHTGVHFKANVYVDEAAWAVSSESEKASFAESIGGAVQAEFPGTSLVDFRSALNNDIVAEGKILGGYDIKR